MLGGCDSFLQVPLQVLLQVFGNAVNRRVFERGVEGFTLYVYLVGQIPILDIPTLSLMKRLLIATVFMRQNILNDAVLLF